MPWSWSWSWVAGGPVAGPSSLLLSYSDDSSDSSSGGGAGGTGGAGVCPLDEAAEEPRVKRPLLSLGGTEMVAS